MTLEEAVKRRLSTLMAKAERAFAVDGQPIIPKVLADCAGEAWVALLHDHDVGHANHLIEVATFLLTREMAKYKADPVRWVQRQRESVAA